MESKMLHLWLCHNKSRHIDKTRFLGMIGFDLLIIPVEKKSYSVGLVKLALQYHHRKFFRLFCYNIPNLFFPVLLFHTQFFIIWNNNKKLTIYWRHLNLRTWINWEIERSSAVSLNSIPATINIITQRG